MPQASAPSPFDWQPVPRGQIHGQAKINKSNAASTISARPYDAADLANRPDFNTSWPLHSARSKSPRSAQSKSRSRGDEDRHSRGTSRDAMADVNMSNASQQHPVAPSSARQSNFAPRVMGLSSPLRTHRNLSQLDEQGSEHFGTHAGTKPPLFDDAFNATSILEAGSITKNNWNINYSIRRVYNGCFSMDVDIRETGQKWELFIQNSDASDNALRLWEVCPSMCPHHIGVFGSWILGCTRLDFDHNKVNGARFDYASLRQMCAREVGMAVTNAARCIQTIARGYITRRSLRLPRRWSSRRSPSFQRKGYMQGREQPNHQFTLLPPESPRTTYDSQDFDDRRDDYASRRFDSPRSYESRDARRSSSPRSPKSRPQTSRNNGNEIRAKSRASTSRNKSRDGKSATRKTRPHRPNVELLVMELSSMRNRLEVLQNTVQQQNDFKEMIETKAQRAINRARQEADEMVKKAKSDAIAELIVLFRSAQQNPATDVSLLNDLSPLPESPSSRSPSPPPGGKPSKKAPMTDRFLKLHNNEAPEVEKTTKSSGVSQFILPGSTQAPSKRRVNKTLGAALKTGGSTTIKQSQSAEEAASAISEQPTNSESSSPQVVVSNVPKVETSEETFSTDLILENNEEKSAELVKLAEMQAVVFTPAPVIIEATPAQIAAPMQASEPQAVVAPKPAPVIDQVPVVVVPILTPLEKAIKDIGTPESMVDGSLVLSYLKMAVEKSSIELASLSMTRFRDIFFSSDTDLSKLTSDISVLIAVMNSFSPNPDIILSVLDILIMIGQKSNKQSNGAAGVEYEALVNALVSAGLSDCMFSILHENKAAEHICSRAIEVLTFLSQANADCKKSFQTSGFAKALHDVLVNNKDSQVIIQSVSKWIVVACTNSYIAQDNFFAACIIDDMMAYMFLHYKIDPAPILTEICNALIALCAGKHVDNIKLIGIAPNCKQFVELIRHLSAAKSSALESVLWTLLNSSAKYPPTRKNFAQSFLGEMLNNIIEDRSCINIVRQYALYLVASLVGDETMHSEFIKTGLPTTVRAIISNPSEDSETRKVATMAAKRIEGGPSESHSGRKASVLLPGAQGIVEAQSRDTTTETLVRNDRIAEEGEIEKGKGDEEGSNKEKRHRHHSRENIGAETKTLTPEEEAAEQERKERHRSRRASRLVRAEVTGEPIEGVSEHSKSSHRHGTSKSRESDSAVDATNSVPPGELPISTPPLSAPIDSVQIANLPVESSRPSKAERRSRKSDLAKADPKASETASAVGISTEAAPIAPGVGPFASVSAQGSIDSTTRADPKHLPVTLTAEDKAALEADLKKVKKIYKALKKQLLEWTETFVKTNGREPSVEDKKSDKSIEPIFAQYFKVSKHVKELQARMGDTS